MAKNSKIPQCKEPIADECRARIEEFEAWYKRHGGPTPAKYFKSLNSSREYVKYYQRNPLNGKSTINPGEIPNRIYEFSDPVSIDALYRLCTPAAVADKGTMHTAIGYYSIWLREALRDVWRDVEPFPNDDERLKRLHLDGKNHANTSTGSKGFLFTKAISKSLLKYGMALPKKAVDSLKKEGVAIGPGKSVPVTIKIGEDSYELELSSCDFDRSKYKRSEIWRVMWKQSPIKEKIHEMFSDSFALMGEGGSEEDVNEQTDESGEKLDFYRSGGTLIWSAHKRDVGKVPMKHASHEFDPYLAAIRTKPFILLAGISGTGKSRMVRQLARGCCPADSPLKDVQKPGNFEIIPVRPNWHDSTELMGYVTRITADGSPKYVLTPFVRFLAKAWQYPEVPFFLCLDEMNLAPVEQYFAEYLSAIESRKWVDAADHSKGINTDVVVRFGKEKTKDASGNDVVDPLVLKAVKELVPGYAADGDGAPSLPDGLKEICDRFIADGGIRIPPNLVVMGTVNMDETTCSFSRKVLDRAMTFELNDVSNMYTVDEINGEGDLEFGSIAADATKCSLLGAKDAVNSDRGKAEVDSATGETAAKRILDYIKAINGKLEDTPFKIGYRSRDEIMIYCLERMQGAGDKLAQALDEATSMKILSRIEGDEDKLAAYEEVNGEKKRVEGKSLLEVLSGTIATALKAANGGTDPACEVCKKKLEFMKGRLNGGFTNFFV